MLMTVSGKRIDSSTTGRAWSHSVSPVTASFGPTSPTMLPGPASSTFVRLSACTRQIWLTSSFLPVRGFSRREPVFSVPE